ncbi:MAG: hypothetical protein C0483_03345 [Pirellula sp.]|nr:hypothetical protein [Pirellula sp.]
MSEDDLKFMKLAIEQARKCCGEDDRTHPKVGVVVVKDGEVLAMAHRGEMTGGEHAEFTALEKKLAENHVAGATIYTTLEPCTSRNHPKVPCADRVIDRRLKRVVIGMLDPNPNICGKGLWALREAQIETDLFPHALMAEIEELNREFIRAHRPRAKHVAPAHDPGNEVALLAGAQPPSPQSSADLATFFQNGDFAGAEQLFERLCSETTDPKSQDELRVEFLYFRVVYAHDVDAQTELEKATASPAVGAFATHLLAYALETVGAPHDAAAMLARVAAAATSPDDKARLSLKRSEVFDKSGNPTAARVAVLDALKCAVNPKVRAAAFAKLSELFDGPYPAFTKAALLCRAASLDPSTNRRFFAGLELSNAGLNRSGMLQYEYILVTEPDHVGALNNQFVSIQETGLIGKAIGRLKAAADKGMPLAAANLAHKYMAAGFMDEAAEWIKKGLKCEDPHELGSAMTALKEQQEDEAKKWSAMKKRANGELRFFESLADALAASADGTTIAGDWRTSTASTAVVTIDDAGNITADWGEGSHKGRLTGSIIGKAIIGKYETWDSLWDKFRDNGTAFLAQTSDFDVACLLLANDGETQIVEWRRPAPITALPSNHSSETPRLSNEQ